MARFMKIISIILKLSQDQLAKDLGCSSSTLQRCSHDVNMLSPYRIPSNSHKRRPKISNTTLDYISNREHDLEKPQLTSIDLKRLHKIELNKPNSNADSAVDRTTRKKRKLKGGSVYGIDEINDEYMDETFASNNL